MAVTVCIGAAVPVGNVTSVVGASVVEDASSAGMTRENAGLKTGSESPWRRASWYVPATTLTGTATCQLYEPGAARPSNAC